MNIHKKITIFTFLIVCMCTPVFANDCNLVVGTNSTSIIQTFDTRYTKYHKALPTPGFERAINNLKAYCCQERIICTSEERNNLPKNHPQSDYLFDHLVDVLMRRLDGIKGPLVYDIDPDPMGAKRTEIMNQIEQTPNGMPGGIIQQSYTGYRTVDKKRTKNIENVLQNYNTENPNVLSLADKYEHVCSIAKLLYESTQVDNKIKVIIGEYTAPKSYLKKCKNMIQERIQEKSAYTQILMAQKSSQFLDEATKAYTNKYFVENKLMNLRGLIAKFKDTFQTIVQQSAASKKCNK